MGQCWEILPSPPHPQAALHPCHVHPGSGSLTRFRGAGAAKGTLAPLLCFTTGISTWLEPTLGVKATFKWIHIFAIIYFGSTSISMADTAGQYIGKEGIRDCL